MHISEAISLSRRAFLRRTGQLSVAGVASAYGLGLAGIGEAAAFSNEGGYKALVCVFLYGGNDHANTLIPFDGANYAKYAALRQSIALPQSALRSTSLALPEGQTLTDDIQYALSPAMPRLKRRYDEGKMAVLLNVGPLEAPLTREQYEHSNLTSFPRPAKLFSHNDQQSTWQASRAEGAPSGWGGRMGDLAQSANSNTMFTAINVTGNAVFLSGERSVPFKVSTGGAIEIKGFQKSTIYGSRTMPDALRQVALSHHQHVFEQDYSKTVERSELYAGFVNEALESSAVSTPFPQANSLADQLKVVANLIAARKSLGTGRQIFMVSIGGFDHHTGLLGPHEVLLGKVDAALDAFYSSTLELGVADQVTTFTASEFGRTLSSNGDGSDHGWGGHHFILGGDVEGGRFYGRAPSVSVDSDDQVGRGRLLPTTSVDEYSTTLASWLGVAPSELSSIAPNIGRFAKADLGFMKKHGVEDE